MATEISDQDIISVLRKNMLFSGLSEQQLEDVLPLIEVVTFQPNDFILKENEKNNSVYIIYEGQVGIYK